MAELPLRVKISVVWSPAPRQVQEWQGVLPVPASVADALQVSGLVPENSTAWQAVEAGHVGVWGHKVLLTDLLQDGDRVEIYRPLLVDPKIARRERFRQQGARTSGLFAKKRPGSKAGY